jgi:hypothetical protein
MRLPSAIRALPAALREQFFNGGMLVAIAGAALVGWLLPQTLKTFLPAGLPFPYTAIAASLLVNLALLAALLTLLSRATRDEPWAHLAAWLGSLVLAAAAFAGLALAKTHGESAHTFFVLWLLFAAQAAIVAALCGLLRVMTGAPRFSLQATALFLGIAMTGLFWSREPITQLAREGQRSDSVAADRLASGVLKLSPPFAMASAWNQECDAASDAKRGNRFDLIRAPLTYDVWIGSYQAMPYPEILPSRNADDSGEYGAREFKPGLVLALLLWGLPLIVFADVLRFSARASRPA